MTQSMIRIDNEVYTLLLGYAHKEGRSLSGAASYLIKKGVGGSIPSFSDETKKVSMPKIDKRLTEPVVAFVDPILHPVSAVPSKCPVCGSYACTDPKHKV